jgi:hypothetical protein
MFLMNPSIQSIYSKCGTGGVFKFIFWLKNQIFRDFPSIFPRFLWWKIGCRPEVSNWYSVTTWPELIVVQWSTEITYLLVPMSWICFRTAPRVPRSPRTTTSSCSGITFLRRAALSVEVRCCLLWRDKERGKENTYIWVSVKWETKDQRWGIYTPRIHCVAWGTGTPNRFDRDEVKRQKVWECEGWARLFIIRGKTRAKENTYRWVSV